MGLGISVNVLLIALIPDGFQIAIRSVIRKRDILAVRGYRVGLCALLG